MPDTPIEPGPDHPITITPAGTHLVVRRNGQVIAESDDALRLQEADYAPVCYFPRGSLTAAAFEKTDRHTHCPYKGEASYFSLKGPDGTAPNAAWSYETPYPAMAAIREHVAFYPNAVEIGER